MVSRTLRHAAAALLALAASSQIGCNETGYNPYTPNNGHRPVGKSIEAVPNAAEDGLHYVDARFENWFY